MEETSVFWVILGYRLRSRLTVPLQGPGGRLTSHLFIISQCYCDFIVPQWYCEYCYCYWLPGGRACSASSIWAVVPGMYGTHLKHRQCLQTISFNKFRTSIDTCDRRSMRCVYYRWQLVLA